MDTELYSDKALQGQASFNHSVDKSISFNPSIDDLLSDSLIEQYRTSPRGDFRVIAALLTIEPECAEIDQEVAPASPVPLPIAADPDDDAGAVDLCAISREIAAYRTVTGQPHAIPPQYRASGRAPRRSIPKRRGIPAKPNSRPAHSRSPFANLAWRRSEARQRQRRPASNRADARLCAP